MFGIQVNWAEVATTVLGSGFLFAIVNVIMEWWRTKKRAGEVRKFLAVQIATLLEGYALTAFDAYSDHGNKEGSGGHIGKWLEDLSEIPSLPQIDGYELLSASLLDRIFQLPQQRTMFAKDASEWVDAANDHEMYWQTLLRRQLELIDLALGIAKDLRKEAGLPSRRLKLDQWDIERSLATEIKARAKIIVDTSTAA